jgi:hypothetical protein
MMGYEAISALHVFKFQLSLGRGRIEANLLLVGWHTCNQISLGKLKYNTMRISYANGSCRTKHVKINKVNSGTIKHLLCHSDFLMRTYIFKNGRLKELSFKLIKP